MHSLPPISPWSTRQGTPTPYSGCACARLGGVLAGIHLKALAQRVEARETDSEASGGIYMSLFQRLGSAAPQQEVSELFPQSQQQAQTSAPVPAPGEFIDDPPTPPKSPALARVITVEVG